VGDAAKAHQDAISSFHFLLERALLSNSSLAAVEAEWADWQTERCMQLL
jgi:hypothetical protein